MSELKAGTVAVELTGRTSDLFREVRDSVRVLQRAGQQITRHANAIAKALDGIGKSAKRAGGQAQSGGKATENAIARPMEDAAARVERAAKRVRAAYASVRNPLGLSRQRTPNAPNPAPNGQQGQRSRGNNAINTATQQWKAASTAANAVARAFNAAAAALQKATGAAVQAGNAAKTAAAGVRKLAGAVGSVGKGAQGLNQVNQNLQNLQNNARRAAGRVRSSLSSAGEAMQSWGKSAMAALTVPITAFGVAAFSVGADFESLRMGLNAVAGSAQEAAVQWERLRVIAKAPGIGFEEAIQGSVRLQAVGFSAERAERNLVEFANAIALTGGGKDNLREVTYQLSQMAAKGKVLSEDLKPIIGQSPAVAKALKMAFGTVNPEGIRSLGLSFEEFNDRLLDAMAKLPRVAGGARNAWDNFVDGAKQAMDRLAPTVLPLARQALDALSGIIERAAGAWETMDPAMRRSVLAFAVLAAGVGPAVYALGTLVTVFGQINTVGRAVVSGLGMVRAAITSVQVGAGAATAVASLTAALTSLGTFLAGGVIVGALVLLAHHFVQAGIKAQQAAAQARQAAEEFRLALGVMDDTTVQARLDFTIRNRQEINTALNAEKERLAILREQLKVMQEQVASRSGRRTAFDRQRQADKQNAINDSEALIAQLESRQRTVESTFNTLDAEIRKRRAAPQTPERPPLTPSEDKDKDKGRTPAKVIQDIREALAEMRREFIGMQADVDAGLMKPAEMAQEKAEGLRSTVSKIRELFGELGQLRGLSGDALARFVADQSRTFDLGGETLDGLAAKAREAGAVLKSLERMQAAQDKVGEISKRSGEERQNRLNDALREGKELMEKWRSPTDARAEALKKLNDMLAAGAISASIYAKEAARIREEFGRQAGEIGAILTGTLREAGSDAAREMARAIIGTFKGERQNLGERLKAILERVVEDALTEALSVRLTKALNGLLGGSGGGGGLLGGLLGSVGLGSLLGGIGGADAPGGSPVAGFSATPLMTGLGPVVGLAKGFGGLLGEIGALLGIVSGAPLFGASPFASLRLPDPMPVPSFGMPNAGLGGSVAGLLGRLNGILGGVRGRSPLGGILGGLGRLFGGGRFGGMSFGRRGGVRFGGFAAAGGGTHGGRAYVVGERGRELFVPGGRGQIVPMEDGDSSPVGMASRPLVIDFSSFPPARNSIEAARDAEHQKFWRETARVAKSQGFKW